MTPIHDNTVTFDKTVVASLTVASTYFVGSPSQATLLIRDGDTLSTNVPVATFNLAMGIDYHSGTNSLLVSINHPDGLPRDFARVAANGDTNDWTTLSGVGDSTGEIKLATVKVATNGWAVGDMYFGTAQAGKIGKISANASSVVTTNWATLSGENNLLGGLYIDQTGVFGGDLIVVSGSNHAGGGVWRVTSSTSATKIAQLNDLNGNGLQLEGVVTVPNDPAKYGPWAGKILTCAEDQRLI